MRRASSGAQGAREPSRDQADPAGARVPCANVRRVVLRGTAVAACRSRRSPDVSRRRALLRRHERPRAEHRAQAQPLLPRSAAASRRQHRGGGQGCRRSTTCSTASSVAVRTGASRPRRSYFDPSRRLAAKYGVNKGRFWVSPGLTLDHYPLNTTAPVVPQQPQAEAGGQLRRSIALRSGVPLGRHDVEQAALTSTCRRRLPGFKQARIYPLHVRTCERRARSPAATGAAARWFCTHSILRPPSRPRRSSSRTSPRSGSRSR